MNNQLTVIIPTSPIPSHPSTEILDETIMYIRKFTDAEIVLMFDWPHSSIMHRKDDYEEYKMVVKAKCFNREYGEVRWTDMEPTHSHQASMTRHVIEYIVKTPLIMFVEHDTYIDDRYGAIPFQNICDFVEGAGEVNCIRFNIFEQIPDEHNYLMIGQVEQFDEIMYQRTIQWSQRPHIARASWYREILDKWFMPNQKTMIEDVMHGVVQEEYKKHGHDTFGLAIYTPEGNQLRSFHTDGRGSDEKVTVG